MSANVDINSPTEICPNDEFMQLPYDVFENLIQKSAQYAQDYLLGSEYLYGENDKIRKKPNGLPMVKDNGLKVVILSERLRAAHIWHEKKVVELSLIMEADSDGNKQPNCIKRGAALCGAIVKEKPLFVLDYNIANRIMRSVGFDISKSDKASERTKQICPPIECMSKECQLTAQLINPIVGIIAGMGVGHSIGDKEALNAKLKDFDRFTEKLGLYENNIDFKWLFELAKALDYAPMEALHLNLLFQERAIKIDDSAALDKIRSFLSKN